MTKSWIFLRGLARSQEHWGDFPARFQAQFPDAEIELIDLAGNGRERERASFLTIEENVRDLRARSQLLRQGRPVSLFCISMGAMIGTSWADQFPEEISRMILINTSDRRQSFFFERLRPRNYLPFLTMIFRKDSLFRERVVLRQTTAHLSPSALQATAERHAKLPQTSVGNFLRQIWAALRFAFPPLTKVPTLIVAGEKDGLVRPICSARIAQNWGCSLVVSPTGGHDLPLEEPEWLCQQAFAWAQTKSR